jgi:YVTN family beta-propeller protein
MRYAIAVLLLGLIGGGADAATVYVAAEKAASLSVVDTTGKRREIPLPINPHNVDLTPDRRFALASGIATTSAEGHATHPAGGELVIVDLRDDAPAITARIAVGSHPGHVVPGKDGTVAYVTDAKSNSVVVVDLKERTVKSSIPVGRSPHGLRLSPDSRTLAVANMGEQTVTLIDLDEPQRSNVITVGRRPTQVAFSPDGSRLVVTLNAEDRAAIIDLATLKVMARPAVGRGPVQLVVTPDDTRALIANQGNAAKPDDRLAVISMTTGNLEKMVQVGSGAHGVALAPDGGSVFVTNTYANTVSEVDLKTLETRWSASTGAGPNGVAAR